MYPSRVRRPQTAATIFFLMLLGAGLPTTALACACGCGMFDLGMPGLGLPNGTSGFVNLQDTWLNQNLAKQDTSKIPLASSPDQKIQTNFLNLNFQYSFNHDWGVMAMLPYWQRSFYTNTAWGTQSLPVIDHAQVSTLADIRLMGMYTGFSPDMSTGLIFGLKLPTGTYQAPGFDRDTEPGTGTTDLLLGGYQVGQERVWGWYLQGMLRRALDTRTQYRPGDSLQLVAGAHYDANTFAEALTPLLQWNLTYRRADSGAMADPLNTGSKSLYLTPGFLVAFTSRLQGNLLLYLPLYQQVNGIQLVPRQIASAGLTYNF